MRAVKITKNQKVREASQRKIIGKYREFGLFTQSQTKLFSKEVFLSTKFFLWKFCFRWLKIIQIGKIEKIHKIVWKKLFKKFQHGMQLNG